MPIPTVGTITTGSNTAGTSLDVSITLDSGSDRALFCWVVLGDNDGAPAVTSVVFDPGGGNQANFTLVDTHTITVSTRNWRVECWRLLETNIPASGTYTVRTSVDISCGIGVAVAQLAGVDQTTPTGAVGKNQNSNSDTPTVDVTTNAADALAQAAIAMRSSTASPFTPGSGDTERWDFGFSGTDTSACWGGDTPAASTGTYTVSATASASSIWAMLGVQINGASAPSIPIVAPDVRLSLHLYESPGGGLIETFNRAERVIADTGEHGFQSLTFFAPMDVLDAFRFYDMAPGKHLLLTGGGMTIWEGRVEDRRIVDGGLELTAFGYQRALSDVRYTALWSTKSYAEWRPVTGNEINVAAPGRWRMDNNNRIYIAMVNGETIGNLNHHAFMAYQMPNRSERQIIAATFDYEHKLPVDFELLVVAHNEGFTSQVILQTYTGTGSAVSGSQTLSFSSTPRDILIFVVRNNTGSSLTYTNQTGADYIKITNLRVKTTTSATVLADEIVKSLVSFVNGINSTQLSSSSALVQSPGVDLDEAIWTDMTPADILNDLIARGDNQTPPRQWQWAVWEDRILSFAPRGDGAVAWYTDVVSLELESNLDGMYNEIYALYSDPNSRALRTSVASDSNSKTKYGITRRSFVNANTTSQSAAESARDALLEETRDVAPRARILMSGLYDAAGASYPLWMLRAGDTLTLRNLPPTLPGVDKIRTFRIASTSYNADTNVMTPTPEALPDVASQLGMLLTG